MGIAITQMLLAIKTGAQRDEFLDAYSTHFGSNGTDLNDSYLWKESTATTGRGTDGDRRKWTFSAWVKRHTFGDAYQCFFSQGSGSNGEGFMAFTAGDTLYFGNDGHSNFVDTDRYYRDNGWYHIMWAVDTTQGTNDNRWKIYVDGDLIPASNYGSPSITQNGDGFIGKHSEPQHPCIGARMRHFFASANPAYAFRGQMAQVYFIEGQQLQPSDFAETVNGVYKPILYGTWSNPNDGTFWRDQLSVSGSHGAMGGFGINGNQPDLAFNGRLQDYTNSARPTNSANDIIFDVPEQLQDKITKLEIYIYGDNVTTSGGFWLDSGSGLNAHSNTYSNVGGAMTWVEYTSLPSTIKRFSFGQRTNGRSTALSAIRINGEILEDGLNIPYADGNSYYLPLDGSTPAGESGGFKRKFFNDSQPVSKATGGLPILNTVAGGNVASTGIRDDYGDRTPAIIKDSGCVFMPGTGGAGGYNDNDYLRISSHADHSSGTGDFCIEYWVYKRRDTDSGHFCVSVSGGYWIGQFESGGIQKFVLRRWGISNLIVVDAPPLEWTHIVVARQSGTSRIFFNGVLKGSASDSQNYGQNHIYIGTDDGYYDHPGGFSNVRYIKGSVPTAYQTSSTTAEAKIFTSPTEKLTLTSQGATESDVKILCCQSKTDPLAAVKTTNTISQFGNVGAASSEITGNTILALPLQAHSRDLSQFACWPTGTGGLKNTSENGMSGVGARNEEANFYGQSYYFDGSNDYIEITGNKYFNIRTSAFTVEMWIKQTAVTDYAAFFGMYTPSSGPQFQFRINNQGRIQFLQDHGGTRGMTEDGNAVGTNLRDEEWHHVAVVRESSYHYSLYVDGVEEYRGTGMTGDIDYGSSGPSRCYLGMRADSQAHLYKGYISDLRVIKAAKYHKDFVPAQTHPRTRGDFVHIPGAEKEDYPSNAVTSGAVMFEKAVQATLECTSTGIPKGSDSRTIEFWAYIHNKWYAWQNIFCYGAGGTANTFGINTSNTGGTIRFTGFGTGDWDSGVPASRYVDAWHHFAVTYDGSNVEIFIDGISIGSPARSLNTTGTTFHIGGSEHGGEHFTGMISNFRVRTGRQYTSTFQPPTEPLTADGNTVLLCCQSATDPTAAAVKPGNLSNPGTGAVATRNNPFDDNVVTGNSGKYAALTNLNRHSSNGTAFDGLHYSCSNSSGGNIRANIAVTSGKWYFESTNNNANRAHVGWQMQEDVVPGGDAGMTAGEWMYRTDEYKVHNQEAGELIGSNQGSIADHMYGATAMIALDADAGKIWFGTNGKWLGNNSTATPDPVAGTGAHFTSVGSNSSWSNSGLIPMVGRRTGDSAQTVNFGQIPFKFTPPAGFLPLSYENLQSNLDITEPKDHFGVITWTGNGSTSGQVVTGLTFKPDLVWIKGRNHSQNHLLHDLVRGKQHYIKADENAQQATNEDFVTQFQDTGIKVGNSGVTNGSGETNLAWCWKAGGEPTTTNTEGVGQVPTAGSVKIDGSNATAALAGNRYPNKMSVNTKAGFSIVHYTGTGNSFTLAHGLNRRPDLVMVKTLDGATVDWMLYTKVYDGSNDWFALNNTGGINNSGFAGANSTVFNFDVGQSSYSNMSGRNYIQYNWTSVPGYSKIGKYLSNGSNSDNCAYAPYINLGFKPALVIIKSLNISTSVTGWGMYTSSLQGNPIEGTVLWANSPGSEGKRGDGSSTGSLSQIRVDMLSEGFKIKNNGNETNEGNGTNWYWYMAFAEAPALYSGGR